MVDRQPVQEERFRPHDAIGHGVQGAMVGGLAGAFISGAQNALAKQNFGFMGVFTRSGGVILMFGAVGGTYTFMREVAANLRETRDSLNPMIAGFGAGAVLGLRTRTLPSVLGCGAGLAVLLGAFEKTGGTLKGVYEEATMDEVARKEYLRKNRRRPYEETIEQVGEGRGIYGPNYQETRRERLKQRYGLDVPAEPVKPYA